MKKKDFENLLQGLREFKAIRAGKLKPGRVFEVQPLQVRMVRRQLKLTQAQFAVMIGVPLPTVRGWEQGRRHPEGPARALLQVAAKRPDAVLEALHTRKNRSA